MSELQSITIPKIIHYCWFGKSEIPEEHKTYIDSWSKYCSDWELKLWDENTFDVSSHPFVKSAYEQKKYAFVSDYVRAHALLEYGGVYLDTDVEVKKTLDSFCEHQAFSGFEAVGLPFSSAVWGAIPNHSLTKKVLDYYRNKTEYVHLAEPPNTSWICKVLVNDFKINDNNDSSQIGCDGVNTIHLYPSSHFCLDIPVNFTTHHFSGTWLHKEGRSYKKICNHLYHLNSTTTGLSEFNHHKPTLKVIAKNLSLLQIITVMRYKLRLLLK